MIDYNLAVSLRDAGFPQERTLHIPYPDFYRSPDGVIRNPARDNMNGKWENFIKIPTLSELIKAAGNITLYKHPKINIWNREFNDKWVAGIPVEHSTKDYLCADDHFVDFYFQESAVGATPEEAVANLWLALNEK